MVRPPYGRCPAIALYALAATLFGASANGAEIVLLDFWSPTCGPCMQMKPTIESLVNARYPIRQVDVSRDTATSHEFKVTGVPCFVMLVDGQEIERVVGATSSERLQQMFAHAKEVVALQQGIRHQDESAPPSAYKENASGSNTFDTPSTSQGQSELAAPIESEWPREFDNRLLSSSVRLTVEDGQIRSHGTGTIIDARERDALIITCGHLFRESKGKAPIMVDLYVV
jgi:thiol-disulfide isomerase/thioredoxin